MSYREVPWAGRSLAPRGTRPRRGALLVITLWIIVILSSMTVAIARHLSTELRLVKYRMAREQAEALARSGVYLAMHRLQLDARSGEATYEPYDWLGDEWAMAPDQDGRPVETWVVPVPSDARGLMPFAGELRIQIKDAERWLSLNDALAERPESLERLLGSSELVRAMVDYVDADEDGESPVEEPPFYPKNGPVAAVEELRALPGMTDDAFAQLARFTVVVPKGARPPQVNLNTAVPEVLGALGLFPSTVDAIVQFRDSPEGPFQDRAMMVSVVGDRVSLTDEERTVLTNWVGISSERFVVGSEGVIQRPPVSVRVRALVGRAEGGEEGIKVLSWRLGGAAMDQQDEPG